ncbi:hypothetical protein T552_04188 [Pneumocystis carinii B80]|uniref:CFEM domain-containing protein n=1 Tax=Pneumocystis carinii (strain B80) TaxID=1408658 RepID=A0A0W4ZDJ5_PNEC8|nr:hypothetical protein T552_04188 [Pneumocystis carinii B80]KTW26394.1 hypothetical protein T552_04188 [Pneumocystis carinii B80]
MVSIFVPFILFFVSVLAKTGCVDYLANASDLSDVSKNCYKTALKSSTCRGIFDVKCICESESYKLEVFSCILNKKREDGINMAIFLKELCKNGTDSKEECLEKAKTPPREKVLSSKEQNVTFDEAPYMDNFLFRLRQHVERDRVEKCIKRGQCIGIFHSTCSILYKITTVADKPAKTQVTGKPIKTQSSQESTINNFASTDLGLFSSSSNLIKLSIALISLIT